MKEKTLYMNSKWKIEIKKVSETVTGRVFEAVVSENGDKYTFKITIDKKYAEELLNKEAPSLLLIQQSLLFLLDRESVTSILRDFNLREIQKYFVDYEDVMVELFK